MKKIICILVLFAMICSPIINLKSYASGERSSGVPGSLGGFDVFATACLLDTPNRQDVVTAEYIEYDGDQTSLINSTNAEKEAMYTSLSRIASASPLYNCHSYAWYSQDYLTNNIRIADPTPYFEDNSYYAVTNPQVGDIICYFDDNGTPNNTADDYILHSGIVVYSIPNATSNGLCGNSDLFIVQSKLHTAGLYHHNGYENQYTDYALTVNDSNSREGTRAEYVRYYRRTGHTHNHSICAIVEGNYDYHKCVCSCGQIIYEAHVWTSSPIRPMGSVTPNYIPQYTCRECGMITLRLS